MKKILLLAFGFCMIAGTKVSHSASISNPVDPILNETLMQMKAADFVRLSIEDFAKLSLKKLSLKEKIAFSVLKKKMRRDIKKNPDMTVGSYLATNRKISTWAWIGIISSVLLLILVIIASRIDI